MKNSQICNRDVVTVTKDASILEAAQKMRAHHIGDVIVTETVGGGEKPLGIVTDRDIVIELVAEQIELDSVSAGDVMSSTLVTVRHDAELFETLRFMGIKGIRRVPVLDDDGCLFGVLSVDDLLGVLTKELSFLADIASRQRNRERIARN